DGRPADLDLERIRHEEFAWFHDRRHRVHDLRPRRACIADDREDLVDVVLLDAQEDRGVRALEEAPRARHAGRAELLVEERVDKGAGVLVVHDRHDELHRAEYPCTTSPGSTRFDEAWRCTMRPPEPTRAGADPCPSTVRPPIRAPSCRRRSRPRAPTTSIARSAASSRRRWPDSVRTVPRSCSLTW